MAFGGEGDSPQPPQHDPARDENTRTQFLHRSMDVRAKRDATQTDPSDQSGEQEAMLWVAKEPRPLLKD